MNTSLPKILITGASGQMGTALQSSPFAKQFNLIPLSHDFLDITQADSILTAIDVYAPDIIINTAAYTTVDKAESEPEKCKLINDNGAKQLAIACKKNNIPLIHLSTDYVFDGNASTPYKETDKVNPISVYGKTKLAGEKAIQANCDKHIILRVSGIFSASGQNFLNTILRLANERTELGIIVDQQTCPTPANAIADTLYTLCNQLSAWGIYHYCSHPAISWYDFATAIIEETKKHRSVKVKSINALKTHEYQTAAKRPPYSVLDCSKIKQTFGIEQPDWHQALTHYLKGYDHANLST